MSDFFGPVSLLAQDYLFNFRTPQSPNLNVFEQDASHQWWFKAGLMSCGVNYVGEASLLFCFFPPYRKLWYSFPCLLPSLDCGCTIQPNYPSSLNKRYYRFGLNLQLNRRMQSEGDNCRCFGEANKYRLWRRDDAIWWPHVLLHQHQTCETS